MPGGDQTDDSVDSFLEEMVRTPGAGTARPLAPGTLIDEQYRIVRALGQGGMGVVYLARDLRLDRDVALKLGNVVSDLALARIEREAVALARLQHPNVVVIHQVGEIDGRLYIAMEHVGGGNAREWVRAKKRGWREVVALYAAAGDGLAAAHAAGFVHRDFKPDNVLVGEDGRPRVADFGLVRGVDGGEDATLSGAGTETGTGTMTATGAVVGTPAYMAPEQIAGEDVDARADQFAFCASLWEALFDARPYRGKTPAEVAASIETTEPRAPAGGVPRHVLAALRRGLARERDARWPSMAALLAQLRRDPRTRRRAVLLAAGAAVVAAGGAVAVMRASAADPCRGGAAAIASTWSPERAASLDAAFAKVGLATSWTALRPVVDRYAAAWAIAHDDACRATRVDGAQSEAILDRRMLCLTRARGALEVVLAAFATGDRGALADAPNAIGALPELAACADIDGLASQSPLPAAPDARAKVVAASRLVDEAKMAFKHGALRDPRALGDRAVAAAESAGWPPLYAEAVLARAELLDDVDDASAVAREYQRAASLAIEAGDDPVAAVALADLADAVALAGKPDQADPIIDVARALWTRTGKPLDVGEHVEYARMQALLVRGDVDGSLAAVRRQIALSQQAYPDSALSRAGDDFNLANVLEHLGRFEEARAAMQRALGRIEQTFGTDHPALVWYLVKAAETDTSSGRIDEAIADARRAVALGERWYGANDPRTLDAKAELGEILGLHGDPDEARALLEQVEAGDHRLGTHPADAVGYYTALATVEDRTGHPDRAIDAASRAITRLEQIGGRDNLNLTAALVERGISERHVGRLDDSQHDLERSLALDVRGEGPEGANAINARIELSYTMIAQGRVKDAVALLEPHLAAAGAPDIPPPVAAELHTALADALWRAGGDRVRARALAQDGLAIYAKLGAPFAEEQRAAEAWLRAHATR